MNVRIYTYPQLLVPFLFLSVSLAHVLVFLVDERKTLNLFADHKWELQFGLGLHFAFAEEKESLQFLIPIS
jgi:hypothetical protein